MASILKKFNSLGGFSVGDQNPIDVVDANANVSANNLSVSGDASITGNLSVLGTVSYIETSTTYISDPLTETGGGPHGNALVVNDNMDRGSVLHYYDTKPVDAFIGWDNSNVEFALASNVTVANNIVSYNNFGNVRLGNLASTGSVKISGNIVIDGSVTAGSISGSVGNAIPLGLPTISADPSPGNLVTPGTVNTWNANTKVTDAIDDLNEAMENVRNNTYVKTPAFNASLTASGVGNPITLTISNTPITTYGTPNNWEISWGDGTANTVVTSLASAPTHTYVTNVGSPFAVSVTATNTSGSGTGSFAILTKTSYITIYTADPVMGFALYRAGTGGSALTGSTLYASEGETVYLENTTTNTSGATVT